MSGAWSPARALAWESLRLSWRPVLGTTIAACGFAAMYRRMLAPLGERRDALVFAALLMTMLVVHALTLLSCRDDRLGIGFEPRLYRLPLPTWKLVVARLLPGLGFVFLMQAAVSWFMRVVFGAPWPVIGPCLLGVAVAAWTLALAWAFGSTPALISPFGIGLLLLLLGWIRPVLHADPLWSRLAPRDAAILGIVTLVATAVAWLGVARSRGAGGARAWSPFHAARRLLESAGTFGRAERSRGSAFTPLRAQLWMEFREKGRLIAVSASLGLLAAVAASSIPAPDTARLLDASVHFVPIMLFVLPLLAGSLHGPFDVSRRMSGMDPFRATRPLGDRELAHALLLAAVRAGAAGWAIVTLGAAVLWLLLWRFGEAQLVAGLVHALGAAIERVGAGRAALLACLVVLAMWSMLGIVAAATLCGRAWVVTLGYVVPLAGVSAIVVADLTSYDVLAKGAPAALVSFGIALPLVAAWAWVAAVRCRLLSARAATLAALLWAAGTALLESMLLSLGVVFGLGSPWPISLWFVAPGLAAAALLPPALAPLALRWNRHR